MKVKVRRINGGDGDTRTIVITGDYIRLDALLKFAGIVQTGGEAKQYIQEGLAAVNGDICIARGKKLRPGDTVTVRGQKLKIAAGEGLQEHDS